MDESDGNGHRSKTNINNFTPIFESDDEEGTKHSLKPNNPTIVLSEYKERSENKVDQNKGNEEYENDQEKKIMAKMYDYDSENEINGDFIMAEYDGNNDNDKK